MAFLFFCLTFFCLSTETTIKVRKGPVIALFPAFLEFAFCRLILYPRHLLAIANV